MILDFICSRLGLHLNDLNEHKFKQNFQDTLDPICNYGEDTETSSCHYLLQCLLYTNKRLVFVNVI